MGWFPLFRSVSAGIEIDPAWPRSCGRSDDPVDQRLAALEALQVANEVTDERFVLLAMATGDVWRDQAAWVRPERVFLRQRLGIDRVEAGAAELAGAQRDEQGVLVDGRAAANIVEEGPATHRREEPGAAKVPGARRVGQEVDDVVG